MKTPRGVTVPSFSGESIMLMYVSKSDSAASEATRVAATGYAICNTIGSKDARSSTFPLIASFMTNTRVVLHILLYNIVPDVHTYNKNSEMEPFYGTQA